MTFCNFKCFSIPVIQVYMSVKIPMAELSLFRAKATVVSYVKYLQWLLLPSTSSAHVLVKIARYSLLQWTVHYFVHCKIMDTILEFLNVANLCEVLDVEILYEKINKWQYYLV